MTTRPNDQAIKFATFIHTAFENGMPIGFMRANVNGDRYAIFKDAPFDSDFRFIVMADGVMSVTASNGRIFKATPEGFDHPCDMTILELAMKIQKVADRQSKLVEMKNSL